MIEARLTTVPSDDAAGAAVGKGENAEAPEFRLKLRKPGRGTTSRGLSHTLWRAVMDESDAVFPVDLFCHGCPPAAMTIFFGGKETCST